MTSRLVGRRALITGGANGLGAATAELFAAEGAKVVIADLDAAAGAAASVVERIVAAGGEASYQQMDVRDVDAVRAGIDAAAAWMGGIDSVVASAGLGGPPGQSGSFRSMLDLDVEHFDVVYDVNVRGVFLTCQRAAQLMVEAGHGGSMVTLASIAAKRPTAGAYSVSKAAVWMLTRCLAHELGPAGIRVNAIGPGYVETELFANMVRSAVGDDPVAERGMAREAARAGRAGTVRNPTRRRSMRRIPLFRRVELLHRIDPASGRWLRVHLRRRLAVAGRLAARPAGRFREKSVRDVHRRRTRSSFLCAGRSGRKRGANMPTYVALIYGEDADWMDEAHRDQMAEYGEFGQAAEKVLVGGHALQPTSTATTVRVQGGKGGDVVTSDGPFAETKEVLGGFYAIECADLDEAIRWAAQIPGAWRGSVEVRPVLDMGQG